MRSRTVKWVVERERERETRIEVWNYWKYGDNSHTDKSQVLDQAI